MFDSGFFWFVVVAFIIWGRPFSRRWQRRNTPERAPATDDHRAAQIEQLENRVAELESRLDFAERLLAPRRENVIQPTP